MRLSESYCQLDEHHRCIRCGFQFPGPRFSRPCPDAPLPCAIHPPAAEAPIDWARTNAELESCLAICADCEHRANRPYCLLGLEILGSMGSPCNREGKFRRHLRAGGGCFDAVPRFAEVKIRDASE